MADIWPQHLFMIGCGNMAGQMLSRWLACGLDPARVTVFRPSGKPVAPDVQVTARFPGSFADGATIVLGMKPYQFADVAAQIAVVERAPAIFVSILAGTTAAQLRSGLPAHADIVRVMPNTPVGVGQGVCALYADDRTSPAARSSVEQLMTPLGLAEWIADEGQFNLVTALSGCGPAYLFRFIDALGIAAARLGLPEDQAARLALAMVRGASTLAMESGESPGLLADRVASPGGMTREGMNILDEGENLVTLLTATLRAARDRGEEMARGK
jgi:pyrroline-5-carboxylate reductase